MDNLSRINKKLSNDIIDVNKISNEGIFYRKPQIPPFKRNTHSPPNQNPFIDQLQLEDYAQQNFCRTHNTNHSKLTCPLFVNMLKMFTS